MTTHEFDLDLPADAATGTATALLPGTSYQGPGNAGASPGVVRRPEPPPRGLLGIIALGMALAGVAAGAVLAAAPAGRSGPPPLSATLSARDVSARGDGAHAVLRLTVENPGQTAANLTALVLDGAEPRRVVVKLAARAGPGQRSVVDVPVRPQCTGQPARLAIRLLVAGTPGGLPVLPAGGLSQGGGLCGLVNSQLPRLQNSLPASAARTDGDQLVLDVPGLDKLDVAGSPPLRGVVQTSAMVGDRLVPASIEDGTRLQLAGPSPCFDGSDGDGVPMSARLLVHTPAGLRQQLVLAGPELALWLAGHC